MSITNIYLKKEEKMADKYIKSYDIGKDSYYNLYGYIDVVFETKMTNKARIMITINLTY